MHTSWGEVPHHRTQLPALFYGLSVTYVIGGKGSVKINMLGDMPPLRRHTIGDRFRPRVGNKRCEVFRNFEILAKYMLWVSSNGDLWERKTTFT